MQLTSDAEAVGLEVEEGVFEAVLLELSVALAEEEAVLVLEDVQLGVEVRDPVLLPVWVAVTLWVGRTARGRKGRKHGSKATREGTAAGAHVKNDRRAR
jgi:hypothetical protein